MYVSVLRSKSESLDLGLQVHRGVCIKDGIVERCSGGGLGGSQEGRAPARSLCFLLWPPDTQVSTSAVWAAEGHPVRVLLPRSRSCLPPGVRAFSVQRQREAKLQPARNPQIQAHPPPILPPKSQGDCHVVSSLGPSPRSRAKEGVPPNLPQNARHWDQPPQQLPPSLVTWSSQARFRGPGPQHRSSDSPSTEASSHASPCPPCLACSDLPKQRCFSPGSLGSPHFRQTCACFPSARAHLGLPPQAPPYPGDKPRIVFIDLINDNTPPPPAPLARQLGLPSKVSLV